MRRLLVGLLCLFSLSSCDKCSSPPAGSRSSPGMDASRLDDAPHLDPLPELKKDVSSASSREGLTTQARVMLPSIAREDALTLMLRFDQGGQAGDAAPDAQTSDAGNANATDSGGAQRDGEAPPLDAGPRAPGALDLRVKSPDGKLAVWRTAPAAKPAAFQAERLLRFQTAGVQEPRARRNTPWAVSHGRLFAKPGTYEVSVAGTLQLPTGPAPFRSAPLSIEVDPSFQPLVAIERVARAAAAKYLPHPNAPRRLKPVMEDTQKNRVVRFSVGLGYDVFFTEVVVDPKGEVLSVVAAKVFTCLAEGTPVATPEGDRPVQELRAGDEVIGFDLERRREITVRVRAVWPARARELVAVTPELRVTPQHPVYSRGSWHPAGQLGAGATLLARGGEARLVTPSPIHAASRVYDLTVDVPHNFFAGGVLVHNKIAESPAGRSMRLDDWEHLDVRPAAR